MGVKSQQGYGKEYKIDAVKLAEQLGSISKAAAQLGVSPKNIYSWRQTYKLEGSNAFPGKGKLSPEDEKIYKFEAEIKRLKMEVEFLKKTASYFAVRQK